VDVELALDLVTVKGEHASERVAVCSIAGMADVHRTGGVGRDEFDQDALGRPGATRAERVPGGERTGERAGEPGVGEKQVEKARSGHLEALEARTERPLERAAEALRDLAGRGAETRCQQQRGLGRVVAE